MDITKLTQHSKCMFSVKLAEKASTYLQVNAFKDLIDKAIVVCWEWMHMKKDAGEILYDFLDNEENGFTLLQEMEEDEKRICAWNCIIDAIAYVSRTAYEEEGVKYLPEPIEIVDDNIFDHMVDSLILCNNKECEYIENIYQECLEELL